MKKYTPKPISNKAKYVQLNEKTPIVEKEVKNRAIQNKILRKSTLQSGTIILEKQIGEKEWLVYGNNMPKNSNNGVWTTQKDNWNNAPVIQSKYSTVSKNSIGNNLTDAYLPNDITANNDQIIAHAGQKIQAKKKDDNTETIKIAGKEYNLQVANNRFATRTNTHIFNNKIIVSTLAPNDVNSVVLSSYSPQNGYEWQQSLGNGKFKIFAYSSENNGWINTGIVSNKK